MIVALNNKSNLNKEEYEAYLKELEGIETSSKLILCPNFLNLGATRSHKIALGSQDVSRTGDGAHTGEVSATQLKSYGVEYAIIGHSERRQNQLESLDEVHEELERLMEQDITPILCIGETLEERQEGRVFSILEQEITSALSGLTEEQKKKIIIAYEPIWSIGTGVIPTKEQIEEVFHYIKNQLPETSVLYGGSANEENIDMLKEITLIDGYLLGGLSLKIDKLKIFLNKLQ